MLSFFILSKIRVPFSYTSILAFIIFIDLRLVYTIIKI